MNARCADPDTRSLSLLPPPVRTKLRSTQILTSLPQIISELLQNSLDANASHVEIGIDQEGWECWVKDDGEGMAKDGMAMLKKKEEEGRYNTSKTYAPTSVNTPSTFGFRGEALASAADVSCLEISSRTVRSRQTWALILKSGQCLYEGPATRWRREGQGTVVCLRDIFYNLPIRRLSHPPAPKTLELIRREIETYALVFPEVTFSLEDINKSREVGSGNARVLSIPKTPSVLAAFKHIHGKALVERVETIQATSGDTTIRGFVSLNGAHSKSHQYLYVNRHPLSYSHLHRLVENAFANSSFTKNALDEGGEASVPRSASRRSPRKSELKPVYVLDIRLPPRSVDNGLEPGKSSMHFSNGTVVTDLLSSVMHSFLVKHGFKSATQAGPTAVAGGSKSREGSPRKKRRLSPADEVDARPRTAPQATSKLRLDSGHSNSYLKRPGSSRDACEADTPVVRSSVANIDCNPSAEDSDILWTDPQTKVTYQIDPRTGNSYVRESGTGTALVEYEASGGKTTMVERRYLKLRSNEQDGMVRHGANEPPPWIVDALKANNVFSQTQPIIRRAQLNLPSTSFTPTPYPTMHPEHLRGQDSPDHHLSSHSSRRSRFFDLPRSATVAPSRTTLAQMSSGDGHTRPHRFDRDDLKDAEVIAQVDRKFIACCLSERDASGDGDDQDRGDMAGAARCRARGGAGGRALVLIDQHAASERVRVERFLKRICKRFLAGSGSGDAEGMGDEGDEEVVILEQPRPVLLTTREAGILKDREDVRAILSRWGIEVQLQSSEATDAGTEVDMAYRQVWVRSVPEVVAKKILTGSELKELLKSFLASVENDELPALPSEADLIPSNAEQDTFWWQKALRWCPRGLLDLVNSRACRGAVMFNDTLNVEQCERLLAQLSDTAFPFQCAHGRPSLVPLVSVAQTKDESRPNATRGKHLHRGGKLQWNALISHTASESSSED